MYWNMASSENKVLVPGCSPLRANSAQCKAIGSLSRRILIPSLVSINTTNKSTAIVDLRFNEEFNIFTYRVIKLQDKLTSHCSDNSVNIIHNQKSRGKKFPHNLRHTREFYVTKPGSSNNSLGLHPLIRQNFPSEGRRG